MNTIVGVWNNENRGKTETLRALANIIDTTFPNSIIFCSAENGIPIKGDFRIVFKIIDAYLGIETGGDPGINLLDNLYQLADVFHCSIIICATRTNGNNTEAVDVFANTRDFQTIWTSTYQTPDPNNHERLNLLKANHIWDLIQRLDLISVNSL